MAKRRSPSGGVRWEFEADYYGNCNCDWGCPCNFNARPTQGNCHGIAAWKIRKGTFGTAKLDGVVFAAAYFFPGLVEQGNAIRRTYIDRKATPEQRKALEAINSGTVGGGIFELFAKLSSKTYPPIVADFQFRVDGPKAYLRIEGILEAESDVLTYPDGTVITPTFTLPHGIEFKEGLATNTKRWWIRDEAMLASHENVYGVVSRVKFTEKGCVG